MTAAAWIVGICLAVAVGVGLAVWVVRDKDARCAVYERSVITVAHDAPQDLPGVLAMYKETCG